jgi:hypothetical protein
MVPATGLEPVRCYSLEPESSASANSATRAAGEGRAHSVEELSSSHLDTHGLGLSQVKYRFGRFILEIQAPL